MTIKQLIQYRGIKKEIEIIKQRYSALVSTAAVQLNGMPSSGKINKPTEENAIKLEQVKKQYQDRLKDLLILESEIIRFVESITDAELAAYVTAKYIECRSEKEIEAMFHYERTTMPKRLRRYLKKKQ